MKIFIASDHAGFSKKQSILTHFKNKDKDNDKFDFIDLGPENEDRVDYPDFANKVCQKVSNNEGLGILVCGSGQGMALRANKFPKIKAALCWSEEITKLSREHNDANVLCLPGRFLEEETILKMIELFLSTDFEGGRHKNRVDKILLPTT